MTSRARSLPPPDSPLAIGPFRNQATIVNTSLSHTLPRGSARSVALSRDQASVLVLLDRTIFYSLIVLIGLTAIAYGTVDPWSQALFGCAVFLLTLLWIIHGLWAGSWHVDSMQLFYPVIALVGLALAQSLTLSETAWAGSKVAYTLSADPYESWVFALRAAALILAGVLLLRFTSNRRRLGMLVHAIIIVAVASALFGIARQAIQHAPGFLFPRLQPAVGYGQFINRNHFAFLMEGSLGLVIGITIMRSKRRELIPLYLASFVVMCAALVLSNSRGGLLALTAELICAALLFVSFRRTSPVDNTAKAPWWLRLTRSVAARAVMIAALLLVIGAGVVWLAGDQLALGVENAAVEMSAADRSPSHEGARRRDIWHASWLLFKQHPFLGAGLGGYWAEIATFHDASGILTPQQAHNDYLELLASGGVVGAALFIWFVIALINQIRETVNATKGFQRAASLGAIVALAGIAVHSIVDFGLHITVNGLMFVALLVILSLKPIRHRVPGSQFRKTARAAVNR